MYVKRLRSSRAERAQAPLSSAPREPSGFELGNVGRCNVFEQPGRLISSALAKPSALQGVRAAISGAPVEPSGLEQPYRAPQRSRACSTSETSVGAVFSSSQAEQLRAPWLSRASSSGNLERPSRAERARAAMSSAIGAERVRAAILSQLQLRAKLDQPFAAPGQARDGISHK